MHPEWGFEHEYPLPISERQYWAGDPFFREKGYQLAPLQQITWISVSRTPIGIIFAGLLVKGIICTMQQQPSSGCKNWTYEHYPKLDYREGVSVGPLQQITWISVSRTPIGIIFAGLLVEGIICAMQQQPRSGCKNWTHEYYSKLDYREGVSVGPYIWIQNSYHGERATAQVAYGGCLLNETLLGCKGQRGITQFFHRYKTGSKYYREFDGASCLRPRAAIKGSFLASGGGLRPWKAREVQS